MSVQHRKNIAVLDAILAARKEGLSQEQIARRVKAVKAVFAETQQEEPAQNPQPGQKMPDGTVYLGQYKPKDRDGKSLSKTFNVFAAPEDLPEPMTYVNTVEYISELKNWHGHDGTNYPTDREIYAALKDGSYNGGWIIPTRDILHVDAAGSKDPISDNLFTHKNTGAFAGKFKTATDMYDYFDCYLSSTEDPGESTLVWGVKFMDGRKIFCEKSNLHFPCRPVRLVEVTSSMPAPRRKIRIVR